jgi:sulfite reductase alpha subunit-like flavoprotein
MICSDGAVNTNVNCPRICSLVIEETDLNQAEKKFFGSLRSFREQKKFQYIIEQNVRAWNLVRHIKERTLAQVVRE